MSEGGPDPRPWKIVGTVALVFGAVAIIGFGTVIGRVLITGKPITGGSDDSTEIGVGEKEPEAREPTLLPGTETPLPRVVSDSEDLPPVPEALVGDPPIPDDVENPGRLADATDRTADAPSAPAGAIEDCNDFFVGKRDDRMRARLKEGLVTPDFSLAFKGLVNPYAMMSTMVLPGEKLEIDLYRGDGSFEVSANGGVIKEMEHQKKWSWKLPAKPGIYCLKIKNQNSGKNMCLHGLVCVPYHGESKLEGYDIGEYETKPLRGNPRYAMPRGFIRVNKADRDTWVSPHLQLGQFVCKQPSAYPKFMLLETRLLLKLEAVIAKLEAADISPDTLYVTSGFRTPHYNVSLGNKTVYSRHLYGDAADVFVDTNGDYRLDDLNKDGRANDRDALYLSTLIDSVSNHLPEHFHGGLGFYGFLSSRTAFVHTDTRGYSARWGFRTGKSAPAETDPVSTSGGTNKPQS